MTWSLNDPTGFLTEFKIPGASRSRRPPSLASHSDQFVVVTTGATKFVNVFRVVNCATDRSLRHVLSVVCYDVVTDTRMVCPSEMTTVAERGKASEAALLVATRGGDFLKATHPLLRFRSSRKRKVGDDETAVVHDDDADENPTTLRLTPEHRFYFSQAEEVVGFDAVPRGDGDFLAVVVEKFATGGLRATLISSSGTSSLELPEVISSKIRSVDIVAVAPSPSVSPRVDSLKKKRITCQTCWREIDADFYRRLLGSLAGENRREPASTKTGSVFLFAFDSGQVLSFSYDAGSAVASPPVLLADSRHPLVHFGVFSGGGSGVADFLFGVSPSGATTSLVLDSESRWIKRDFQPLPDSPRSTLSSFFGDLFFCSKSFLYAIDPRKINGAETDSPHDVASSRLFSHANIDAFCLVYDPDLGRIPDLIFFLDARGEFHYRRLAARGSPEEPLMTRIDESGQMSNLLSKAAELTARRERTTVDNQTLNDVLEALTVGGHLRACGAESKARQQRLLRVEFEPIFWNYGDTMTACLELTLWNDAESYVFEEGWNWSLVMSGRSIRTSDAVSAQRSASLSNLRPGHFRKMSVSFQDLGLEVSNAFLTNIDVRVVITFSYPTFLNFRREVSRPPSLLFANENSDYTLAFPIFEKNVDFMDLMRVEWKKDSVSASAFSAPSDILSKSSFIRSEDSGAESISLNDSLIAERLVDDVAESRPEMFVFEELLHRRRTETLEPGLPAKNRPANPYEARLDLTFETVTSLGLSSKEKKPNAEIFAKAFGVKPPADVEDVFRGSRVVLKEPFNGRECSVVFRREGDGNASSTVYYAELVSPSPSLLYCVRQLITRRLGETSPDVDAETADDDSFFDDSVVKTNLKRLDEVERKLRELKRRLMTDEDSRDVRGDVNAVIMRLLEADLASR